MSEKKFVEFRSVQHLYHGQVTDSNQLPDALLESFSSLRNEFMRDDNIDGTKDAYFATLVKLNEIVTHARQTGDGVTIRLSLEVVAQHDGDFAVDLGLTPEQDS